MLPPHAAARARNASLAAMARRGLRQLAEVIEDATVLQEWIEKSEETIVGAWRAQWRGLGLLDCACRPS